MISIDINKYDLAAVLTFYATCNYRNNIASNDDIVTASDGDSIIGVVRLCLEEGVLVLRGMEVSAPHQRTGIGSLMLLQLDNLIGNRECWGISLNYLEGFYGQIDFHFVEDSEAPSHLLGRLKQYRTHNKLVNNGKINRIMYRAARP